MKKHIVTLLLNAAVLLGAAQNEFGLISGVRLCDTVVVTDNNSYFEDFSTSPECWDLMPGSNPWNCFNGCLQCHYNTDNYVDTSDAVTPVLDISTVTSPMLKFALKRQDSWGYMSAGDYLTVSFRNAAGSDTSWIPIVTLTGCTSGWRYDSVALPADMSFIQLKFTCITKYYSFGISIDDVVVCNNIGEPIIPVSPMVTTEPVTGLTEHSATMHSTVWNPYYVPVTSMGFEWKSVSDSNYSLAYTDTLPIQTLSFSPTYTLQGLDESITFTYRSFITYNDTIVYGEEMLFSTFECDAPTGLHASDVGLDYIILEWDEDPDIDAWQVWCGADGNHYYDQQVFTNVDTFHYQFVVYYESAYHFGHSPLYYQFAVRAHCGGVTWGPWSNRITVATPYVGVEERLEESISLYPNPTKDHIAIHADGDINVTSIEVYDIYGKIVSGVETQCITSLHTQINVSNLAAGMYFIRISTDQGSVTKPFVKH